MKKSLIITVLAFVLGVIILAGGFILLTDNNISKNLFPTTATTTSTTTTTTKPSGEEKPTYEPMNFFNEDVTKYITLGEYKNLDIPVAKLEASDEEVKFQIDLILFQNKEFVKAYEGTVNEKVFFSFDYTGYLENEDGTKGEAFSGGSSKGQHAYIDGDDLVTVADDGTLGGFINGFAQGISGKNVGETFDIKVTFPENYNPTMAGKKAIFEIKLNYIANPSFTDGWVNAFTDGKYKTTAEYEQYVRDSINATLKEENEQVIWQTITNNATVIEIPQQQFDYQYNAFVEQIESYRSMYMMYGQNYTFEEMLVMFNFSSIDDLKQYTRDYIKADLVYYAIMQAEGIEASDEEYRILLDELIEVSEMTEEQILEKYGEEYIRQRIMLDEVTELVLTSNKLVQKTTKNQQ